MRPRGRSGLLTVYYILTLGVIAETSCADDLKNVLQRQKEAEKGVITLGEGDAGSGIARSKRQVAEAAQPTTTTTTMAPAVSVSDASNNNNNNNEDNIVGVSSKRTRGSRGSRKSRGSRASRASRRSRGSVRRKSTTESTTPPIEYTTEQQTETPITERLEEPVGAVPTGYTSSVITEPTTSGYATWPPPTQPFQPYVHQQYTAPYRGGGLHFSRGQWTQTYFMSTWARRFTRRGPWNKYPAQPQRARAYYTTMSPGRGGVHQVPGGLYPRDPGRQESYYRPPPQYGAGPLDPSPGQRRGGPMEMPTFPTIPPDQVPTTTTLRPIQEEETTRERSSYYRPRGRGGRNEGYGRRFPRRRGKSGRSDGTAEPRIHTFMTWPWGSMPPLPDVEIPYGDGDNMEYMDYTLRKYRTIRTPRPIITSSESDYSDLAFLAEILGQEPRKAGETDPPRFKYEKPLPEHQQQMYLEREQIFRDDKGMVEFPYRLDHVLETGNGTLWRDDKAYRDAILAALPDSRTDEIKKLLNISDDPYNPLDPLEAQRRYLTQRPGFKLREGKSIIRRHQLFQWFCKGTILRNLHDYFFEPVENYTQPTTVKITLPPTRRKRTEFRLIWTPKIWKKKFRKRVRYFMPINWNLIMRDIGGTDEPIMGKKKYSRRIATYKNIFSLYGSRRQALRKRTEKITSPPIRNDSFDNSIDFSDEYYKSESKTYESSSSVHSSEDSPDSSHRKSIYKQATKKSVKAIKPTVKAKTNVAGKKTKTTGKSKTTKRTKTSKKS